MRAISIHHGLGPRGLSEAANASGAQRATTKVRRFKPRAVATPRTGSSAWRASPQSGEAPARGWDVQDPSQKRMEAHREREPAQGALAANGKKPSLGRRRTARA
jgi:hypothetical protein